MNKTILITGSTDGIGKLAAIELARLGHDIYLHGRDPQKLQNVIKEIMTLSGNEKVDGFVADFSNLTAVKKMVSEINERIPKIDVLINNAGIFKSTSPDNDEGFDIRITVNYFAPFVLTKGLLALLDKENRAHIINLSSAAQSPVNEDVLLGKKAVSEMQSYSQSKLAITMWSMHLAKTLKNTTVIPVNPGSLLDTNMVREAFGHSRSSASKGGDILVQLALSKEIESFSGKYYDNDKGAFGSAHPDAYDEQKVEELVQLTHKIVGD